jgi:UDP-galactopyranose mutase
MYDFLIVGAGLFGATFARLATDSGKNCLVIDKRPHIAGNCYTYVQEGIHIHAHGPHIFHCNEKGIWDFVNRFSRFNNFRNSPIAINNGRVYSLPFSMYTFNQLWGVTTPEEAHAKIESQKLKLNRKPVNLEEQALSLIGTDIYNTLIYQYTKKQWQKDPKDLPASIINRIPVRFTWNNNYFNDQYQGIPTGGYSAMFDRMFAGIKVLLEVDYFANREYWNSLANEVVFTGNIDEFYGFCFGELEYRTLKFNTKVLRQENYQGNAVVNYSSIDVPWTRVIEHKHFEPEISTSSTVITKETPDKWSSNKIPYYPVRDKKNEKIYLKYKRLTEKENNVIFGGRLAEYKYYDMHQVINSAFSKFKVHQN